MLFNVETSDNKTHARGPFTVVAIYEGFPQEGSFNTADKHHYLTLCFPQHNAGEYWGRKNNHKEFHTMENMTRDVFDKYAAEELQRPDNIFKIVRLYGPAFDKLKNG